MLPQVPSASASSVTGPRGDGEGEGEGERFCSSHHVYASAVSTWIAGMATSAGRDGGGGTRNWRSPRPQANASAAPPVKKATSAPSFAAKWSSSCRGTALPASVFTACSAAAPSLEPPPNPARTGIRLASLIATPK